MKLKAFNNPVLSSELKIRMRGWKTALGIALYLGVMILIAFLYYITFVEGSLRWDTSINARQSAGMSIYTMLAILQFSLILLITPAQTAGTISSEREKQTLDLLLCTKLSSLGIIVGKLLSSMSYMLLLIFTSIPLFSLIFLFGGITPGDIAILFLFYIITAFAVGSIGIFCSTFFKKTVAATVVTYIAMFTLGLISTILGIYMATRHFRIPNPTPGPYTPFVLYVNPAVGLADIITRQASGQSSGIYGLLGVRSQMAQSGINFWVYNSIVILVIAFCLLGASVLRINPVNRIFRKKSLNTTNLE